MGCSNSTSDKQSNRKTVFHSLVFRIPALYYNGKEKKLFAFSEKRISIKDSDTVALVMRTGTVNTDDATRKKTWSKPEEVIGVIEEDKSKYRPMNPCVVYEENTQTLFLFFIHVTGEENAKNNKVHLRYITKKKNDDKWREFTDLNDLLPTDKWSTFAVGPGHGIQTKSGRMIVPAYAYIKKSKIPHSFYIYSDDKGRTWQYDKILNKTSLECQMAEVFDSKGQSLIYCNARNQGGYRVQAEINNSGFNSITPLTPLKELDGGSHGSVISFPAQSGEPNTKWLLFSHPTKQKKRLDLGIYLSKSPVNSNGNCSGAWSKPWVINKGPNGYSDLAYIEDGWFACLVECGEKTYTEEIACLLFSYDEILKGVKG